MFNIKINKVAIKWIIIEEETLEADNKKLIFLEEETGLLAQAPSITEILILVGMARWIIRIMLKKQCKNSNN